MKVPRPVAAALALAMIAAAAVMSSCTSESTLTPPAKELDSGTIPNGGVYVHTFTSAGRYKYHCTIHGTGMAGEVVVAPGAPDSALVTIGPGTTYSPAAVSVDTAGTVRWINTGSSHTVTSD